MRYLKKIAPSTTRLYLKVIISGLILTILFIFLINIAISPLHKMKEFGSLVKSDSLFLQKYDNAYNQPEMISYVKEKAYKEALLKLSESDSIQMVVDLADSTVSLSIKGVIIHQTKTGSYKIDKIFQRLPLIQEVKLLSQPLPVYSQYATIVKEPVVIRNAPKDTLEAALNAWQPDTLVQNPAFLILSLSYGINIILEQDRNPMFRDRWKKFKFHKWLGIRNSVRALSDFVMLKKLEYHPTLKIKLPVNDLRAIYRALPDNSLVVIHLN